MLNQRRAFASDPCTLSSGSHHLLGLVCFVRLALSLLAGLMPVQAAPRAIRPRC